MTDYFAELTIGGVPVPMSEQPTIAISRQRVAERPFLWSGKTISCSVDLPFSRTDFASLAEAFGVIVWLRKGNRGMKVRGRKRRARIEARKLAKWTTVTTLAGELRCSELHIAGIETVPRFVARKRAR